MIGYWIVRHYSRLRQAETYDDRALSLLHSRAFAHGWTEDDMADLLRQPVCRGWVLQLPRLFGKQTIKGALLCNLVAEDAEILTLFVDPCWQGLGIAKRLMTLASAELARQGARRWTLEVSTNNQRALRLYEGLGFKKTGSRPSYYHTSGTAQDALILSSSIT